MTGDKLTVQKLLIELGYTSAEAETYWALLNLESVSVRKVASYSGINRGTTYDAIKQLVRAGLVTTRRVGERDYYSAESPEKIYDLIRDRRKELWHSQQRAQVLIPELLARKAMPQGRPLVKYYEGDEGVVTILRDVLQTTARLENPEYYVYSSLPLRQYLYRQFPEFTDQRIEENIAVKVIAIGEGGDPASASERRWLPNTDSDDTVISSYTIIYGDKFALISISNDETPYGVVIEDSGTASMQRLLFDTLWARLA